MDVQLLCPEPIRPRAAAAVDKLAAKHVRVERVRAVPIGAMDDAVNRLRLRRRSAYRSSSGCRSIENSLGARKPSRSRGWRDRPRSVEAAARAVALLKVGCDH